MAEQGDPGTTPGPATGPHRPRLALDHVVAVGIGTVVVFLLAWTGYLAEVLPHHYNARNWNVMWVGFDIALSVVLAYAAWAAWFRRRVMIVTALVAGTLLMCDAWFDVVSSLGNKDAWFTLITALGGEIPLALFLFWLSLRILRRVAERLHELSGAPGPPPRLRDVATMSARKPRRDRLSPPGAARR